MKIGKINRVKLSQYTVHVFTMDDAMRLVSTVRYCVPFINCPEPVLPA